MLVGYAPTTRTSTADQIAGLDAQARELRTAGCTKLFSEQVSSVARRPSAGNLGDRNGRTLLAHAAFAFAYQQGSRQPTTWTRAMKYPPLPLNLGFVNLDYPT